MDFDQQYDKTKSVTLMPVEVKSVKSLSNGTVDVLFGSQDGQDAVKTMLEIAPWLHKVGALVFIPERGS